MRLLSGAVQSAVGPKFRQSKPNLSGGHCAESNAPGIPALGILFRIFFIQRPGMGLRVDVSCNTRSGTDAGPGVETGGKLPSS